MTHLFKTLEGRYGILAILVLLPILFWGYFMPLVNIPSNVEQPTAAVGERAEFLKIPEGFRATYYAKGVPGARVIEFVPPGMLVSQTSEDKISLLTDEDGDGTAETVRTLIDGLNSPHGIATRCLSEDACELYVAEHDALSRYAYDPRTGTAEGREELVALEASADDRHTTRTIMFLGYPYENTLLISVGSSCNVCHEEDLQRGRIVAYDVETGELTEYARGLRNAVFMTLNPINGFVFMTEMGRDRLGDDIPPDEVNFIDPAERKQTGLAPNFGWPVCYGKNIHDTDFDKNTYIRNPCMHPYETQSWLDLPAHVAPLGLAFFPEEGWPEEWWFDLLIAEHGSWNSSTPVGYKIVKTEINGRGSPSESEDFITGWLTESGEKLGRPVDIKILSGGTMYVSDDLAGVIYKVSRN